MKAYILEFTADDEQVWLMLHSGSRNIGKEIAERHIDEAKGLDHNLGLPYRDLAVLVSGRPRPPPPGWDARAPRRPAATPPPPGWDISLRRRGGRSMLSETSGRTRR